MRQQYRFVVDEPERLTSTHSVVFRLRNNDGAFSVSLIGTFNDWSTTRHPMKKFHDRWETTVELPAGDYRYSYFVLKPAEEGIGIDVEIWNEGGTVVIE